MTEEVEQKIKALLHEEVNSPAKPERLRQIFEELHSFRKPQAVIVALLTEASQPTTTHERRFDILLELLETPAAEDIIPGSRVGWSSNARHMFQELYRDTAVHQPHLLKMLILPAIVLFAPDETYLATRVDWALVAPALSAS